MRLKPPRTTKCSNTANGFTDSCTGRKCARQIKPVSPVLTEPNFFNLGLFFSPTGSYICTPLQEVHNPFGQHRTAPGHSKILFTSVGAKCRESAWCIVGASATTGFHGVRIRMHTSTARHPYCMRLFPRCAKASLTMKKMFVVDFLVQQCSSCPGYQFPFQELLVEIARLRLTHARCSIHTAQASIPGTCRHF